MPNYQVAQVNIGRVKAPIEDPLMAGFVSRLDEINALADGSPGFVWRLQTPVGNATYFRPYPEDDRILINMSVWGRSQHYATTSTRQRTPNSCGDGSRGLRSSQGYTWHCGGFLLDIDLAWTKPPNVWRMSKSTGLRSSPLISGPHSSPTKSSSRELTGRLSYLVRRPRLQTDRMHRDTARSTE